MKKSTLHSFILTAVLFLAFLLFTAAVLTVDVQPIGPEGSPVGFAKLNGWFRDTVKVNLTLYKLTDHLGCLALLVAAGFGCLGLYQLVKQKSLLGVNYRILLLGVFYVIVLCFYVFFEIAVVNFRPVILEEGLEASYPSSHTVLGVCIMLTAMMEFRYLFWKKKALCDLLDVVCWVLCAAIVLGRLISGVHWLTDIMGGMLLSASLVLLYRSAVLLVSDRIHEFMEKKC